MPDPTVETLSFDDFSRGEEAWNDLVAASGSPYPFLLHAWLATWWRHFGAGQQFEALVVREGPVLLAAAPLAVRRVRAVGGTVTVAEIVRTGPVPTRGMGLADKADLPVRRGAAGALAVLAGELVARLTRVDVLDLKGIDEDSPTSAALVGAAARAAGAFSIPRSISPFLTLPGSWDAYLAGRSAKTRKYLRRCRRRLEDLGAVSIERAEPGVDLGPWLREVLEIDAASWTARRGTNLFRHPAVRGFFLDVLPALGREGRIDLHVLRLAGRAAAYEICFDFGGRVFSYNGGYRAEYRERSPGTLLTAAVIEAACGRGRTEYDMLRGGEAYKTWWSRTLRREREAVVHGRRARARVHALLGIRVKERLRRIGWLVALDDRLSGMRAKRNQK